MKRTYSFFAWIVSSILLAGTASAQSPCLDALSPAWVHLLANHPALQSAEAKRASQQASLDAAQAAKLPRLDASASYQLNSAVPKLHLEIPLATGQTMVVDRDMGDHDRAELGVTASYAVFTGFAQTRREEAQKFSLDVAQLESANTRNALGLRFGLLHLGIQAARHNLELQILHTGVLHAHVQTLESQERAGVVLPAQKLAALADL
ncbi:MAG TPA: TolC family protein, partial [Fibrobacteraceae bacterium]|nr:TolC family protein [Fibrobacteraceae bacterium]